MQPPRTYIYRMFGVLKKEPAIKEGTSTQKRQGSPPGTASPPPITFSAWHRCFVDFPPGASGFAGKKSRPANFHFRGGEVSPFLKRLFFRHRDALQGRTCMMGGKSTSTKSHVEDILCASHYWGLRLVLVEGFTPLCVLLPG